MAPIREFSTEERPGERAARKARERAARAIRAEGHQKSRDAAARADRLQQRNEPVREVSSRKRNASEKERLTHRCIAKRRANALSPVTALSGQQEAPLEAHDHHQEAANAGGMMVPAEEAAEDMQQEALGRRVRRQLTQHPHAASRGSGAQRPAAGAQHRSSATEHREPGVPSSRPHCPEARLADTCMSQFAGSRRPMEAEDSQSSAVLLNVPGPYKAEVVEQPVPSKRPASMDEVTTQMDGMNTDDEEDDENEQRQKQVSSGAARGGVLAPAGNQLAPQSPHQATPPSPAHSTSSTGSAVGLLRMSSLSGSCLVPLWEPEATDSFQAPSVMQQVELPDASVLADMAALQGWAPLAAKGDVQPEEDGKENDHSLMDDWTQ